jgi:hypothetical protein
MTEIPYPDRPVLSLFPYLQIGAELSVGPWTLTPLSQVRAQQQESLFGQRAIQAAHAFRDPRGVAVPDPTIVSRSTPEQDAERTEDEEDALETAIDFAIIDSNAKHGFDIQWDERGMRPLSTLENGQFFTVALDLANGFIWDSRGSLNQQIVSGLRLDDSSFSIATPAGLMHVHSEPLDSEVVQAAYEIGVRAVDQSDSLANGVAAALHWYLKAWDNSESVSIPDRVVYLKTALESMSQSHKTHVGSPILESIYESGRTSFLGHRVLLRDDQGQYARTRPGTNTVDRLSAFGHWYANLADMRNRIIHEAPDMDYAVGSVFDGNIYRVAERVCREMIRIQIARLGYPRAFLDESGRKLLDHMVAAGLSVELVAAV